VKHARLDAPPARTDEDAGPTLSWRLWLPVLLWLQLPLVEYLVSGSWRGQYSYRTNYISQLGVQQCSEGACNSAYWLLNVSLVLVGVGGAILVQTLWRAAHTRAPAVLFALASVGVIVAGACPENVIRSVHSGGAEMFFIFAPAGVLVMAVHSWQWMGLIRYPMAIVSALGIASLIVYLQGEQSWISPGVLERVLAYATLAGLVLALWSVRELAGFDRLPTHGAGRRR
jgi:hypothetical membrane protein